MTPDTAPVIGCNVIDPELQVGPGSDYTIPITRRSLEFSAECGFDAVEFSHCLHWSDDEVRAVREMAEQIGIGVWSIHAWGGGDVADPAGAEETVAMLTRATEVALGLGAGRIVHHTCGQSLEGRGQELLGMEAGVITRAAAPGVRFALENGSKMAQMEYLLALVDALSPDIAGICIDTGHAHIGNELGAGRAIRLAGERLITTHTQDNEGAQDQHMAPGDGTIDWDDVGDALVEIGYKGCIMLELTDHPSEDREPQIREEIRRGAAMARRIAAKVRGV